MARVVRFSESKSAAVIGIRDSDSIQQIDQTTADFLVRRIIDRTIANYIIIFFFSCI